MNNLVQVEELRVKIIIKIGLMVHDVLAAALAVELQNRVE
jgi:hypothetical protein